MLEVPGVAAFDQSVDASGLRRLVSLNRFRASQPYASTPNVDAFDETTRAARRSLASTPSVDATARRLHCANIDARRRRRRATRRFIERLALAALLAIAIASVAILLVRLIRKNQLLSRNCTQETAEMMVAFNRAILAQSAVVVGLYVVPLEAVASGYYIWGAIAHFVLTLYPLFNYAMIIFYLKPYRQEVVHLARREVSREERQKKRQVYKRILHEQLYADVEAD
ncbi:hypothetical protein AAVH_31023, partial [Aphelenchoides avenae]